MSTIHDQAMNYVYQQVLQRLLSFFSRAERTALQLLIQRLMVAAGGAERMGDYKVLVTPSGTRDSCYTLALLRAAQLSIAGRAPATFKLRVAILRSGGMGGAPLDNLHRSFAALFLYDDPRVELLMVDHRQVLPFNHLKSPDKESADANRINLLMMGHRRARDEQLELWDDVCLARAEFCGQIARWNNGVDAWVASESPRRQKQFINDLARAVQKAGLEAPPSNAVSFDDLFAILDGLGGICIAVFTPNPNYCAGVPKTDSSRAVALHSSIFTTWQWASWRSAGRCLASFSGFRRRNGCFIRAKVNTPIL